MVITNFENRKIGNVLPCGSTTRRAIDKWRLPSNLACLKGAHISFHGFSFVVGRDTGGGELVWGGILARGILNIFPCTTRTKSPMDKQGPQLDSTD